MICDNTNHKGNDSIRHLVTLTEEFDNETCCWCEDCIHRDNDMVAGYATAPINQTPENVFLPNSIFLAVVKAIEQVPVNRYNELNYILAQELGLQLQEVNK